MGADMPKRKCLVQRVGVTVCTPQVNIRELSTFYFKVKLLINLVSKNEKAIIEIS